MALSDYINRRYDYLALRGVTAPGDALLGLELFNENTSGEICTGIQKLSQRWALEFLTESGSMTGRPDRGCNFMRAARQGLLRVPINVRTEFSAADAVIRQNLIAEETDDMPLDEQFLAAELTNFSVLPGYAVDSATGASANFLSLQVTLTSRAENNRALILPIELTPRSDQ